MNPYWEHLQQLLADGSPFVSVTLVDVVASAPANIGAKMLVTEAGLFHGTIGGGKVELRAIAEAWVLLERGSRPIADGESGPWETTRFVEWNLQRDVGMTCGGAVRLFFEAYNLQTWPIVIFGAGHCAQALVRTLLTMPCQITVIDARDEWLSRLPSPGDKGGKLRLMKASGDLPVHVKDLPRNAFVLLMTMGHASDQPILIEILKTRTGSNALPYVGVIGSAAKAAALKRGLLAAGFDDAIATARTYEGLHLGGGYYCPIGLPIGSNDPAEIAISVAAQLLQQRDALRVRKTV